MRTTLLLIFLVLFFEGFVQQPKKYDTRYIRAEAKPDFGKDMATVSIGFKAGYNKSMINGHDSNGHKTGYRGGELYTGFFMDTHLSSRLNLKNELLFSWTNDYHFIEIPVHLRYKFKSRWSVFAGPKLDIIADNDSHSSEVGYKFKNFGVSGELGLQYNIRRRFFAETRYALGFTKQVTDYFLDINNARRNTFRIGGGIRF